MHVNNQWDIEYREQEEAFRRYRYDSQQAQTENHALIAKLKREKEESAEEIKTLNFELQRLNRELESLRQRLDSVEPQQGRVAAPSYAGGRGGVGVGVSLQRVAALEEEIALLRQQVSQSDCTTVIARILSFTELLKTYHKGWITEVLTVRILGLSLIARILSFTDLLTIR